MIALTSKKTISGVEFNLTIEFLGNGIITFVNVVGEQSSGFNLTSEYKGIESVKSLLLDIHTRMEYIAESLNGWESAIEHLENEGFEKVK